MSKLVVATSFPITPPRSGGQRRVRGLYGALAARGVTVDVVALDEVGTRPRTVAVAPGLREIRVPRTRAHAEAERALSASVGDLPVGDISLVRDHALTPAYGEALRAAGEHAGAAVASHPWAGPALRAALPELALIYDAHNVEVDLKADALPAGSEALELVERCEGEVAADAALILACSDEDATRLARRHRLGGPIAVVPNGCDCAAMPYADADERARRRAAIGLDAYTAVFVGFRHGPNVVAADAVLAAARELRDVHFCVVGTVGEALRDVPPNVDRTGSVPEAFLVDLLGVADVAVNPMASGSGTNLKMLDYAASGVPLVASAVGARGLGLRAGEHYVAAEPSELAAGLRRLRAEAADAVAARVEAARERVRATFDWPVIADTLIGSGALGRMVGT